MVFLKGCSKKVCHEALRFTSLLIFSFQHTLEQSATRKFTRYRTLKGSGRDQADRAGQPFTGRFAVASQASITSILKMYRLKQSKSVFHLLRDEPFAGVYSYSRLGQMNRVWRLRNRLSGQVF